MTMHENVLTLREPQNEAELDDALPRPVGYSVLIAVPRSEETFQGTSLVKADRTKQHEEILTMVGLVVDMGDMAYRDEKRFPTGPWCIIGDWVVFRPNSGTRFRVGKSEYRLINDDSIEAVVKDPRSIQRV